MDNYKVSPKRIKISPKKYWIQLSIVVIIIITIVMLFLYAKTFSYLSNTPEHWGHFGAYLGSISGLLAFAGVLYSIRQSIDVHTEDSERNTFFKLIELHNNKLTSTTIEGDEGCDAFKNFNNIADNGLKISYTNEILRKNEINNIDEKRIEYIYNYDSSLFKILDFNYRIYMNDLLFIPPFEKEKSKIVDRVKRCYRKINLNKIDISSVNLHFIHFKTIGCSILESYTINYNELCINMNIVQNCIYKEYGHIIGHYFRNMYYVMDSISNFSDKKNYRELFRAQLSRYELTLCLFNAVGDNSSLRLIELIQEFEILKDIFPDDIFILKPLLEKEEGTQQERILKVTNKILNEHKAKLKEKMLS